MITRREFIKGMGALALLPMIPAMLMEKPERKILIHTGNIPRYVRAYYTVTPGDGSITIKTSEDGIKWDNTGTMTIPHVEDGERTDYKVRYTVTEDGTEAEIVGEE